MDKSFEKEEKELLLNIQKFYWEYLQEYMARDDADISTVNMGIGLLRGLIYISTKFQFEKEIEFKPIKRTEFEPMLMDSLDWNAKKRVVAMANAYSNLQAVRYARDKCKKNGAGIGKFKQKTRFPHRTQTNQSI